MLHSEKVQCFEPGLDAGLQPAPAEVWYQTKSQSGLKMLLFFCYKLKGVVNSVASPLTYL